MLLNTIIKIYSYTLMNWILVWKKIGNPNILNLIALLNITTMPKNPSNIKFVFPKVNNRFVYV